MYLQPNQSTMAPVPGAVPQGSPGMAYGAAPSMTGAPAANAFQNPVQQAQAYAHGGRIKRGKMVIAHMNPHELSILDHLQGKIEKCPRSGMRSYTHLEEILKNPHLLASVHHHAREHHAKHGHHGHHAEHHAFGGNVGGHHDYHNAHLNHLAEGGLHGDSELALIGPHTKHVFDQLASGSTHNPHTGHPQYWSLGGALGGLWNTIKGGVSKIAPTVAAAGKALLPSVMPAIQNFAQSKLGPVGGAIAGALPGLAEQGLNRIAGPEGSNPRGEAIGKGLAAGAEALRSGQGAGRAIGAGLSAAGQGMAGSPMGEAMSGMGEGLQQGRGIGASMMQGGKRGFERAGGMGALARGAQNVMGAVRGGQGVRQALAQQGRQAMSEMMPSNEQFQNARGFQELPFANADIDY